MAIIKQGKVDKLDYIAFETRTEMGEYSAKEAAKEFKGNAAPLTAEAK